MMLLSGLLLIFSLNLISGYDYDTKYFMTYIDHFSFSQPKATYKMRYLVNDKYWEKGNPILFYTGNEGDITVFVKNTGFLWEQSIKLKALVVFAEHRYYGVSLPFGKASFSNITNRGYLSAAQALADYAMLVKHLKTSMPGAQNSPVIAMGGSYGGMLAAYFRIKYPTLVAGALAASAPILMVDNLDNKACLRPYQVLTRAYQTMSGGSKLCPSNIRKSWKIMANLGKSNQGRRKLSEIFKTCNPVLSSLFLQAWLSDILFSLGMINYPYPTNFLVPTAAWPVKVFCKSVSKRFSSDEKLLQGISDGLQVYTNYTGTTKCNKIGSSILSGLDAGTWNYQTCTELPLPMCADGINDMFPRQPFVKSDYDKACQKDFSVSPRWLWASASFGGGWDLRGASNIIFTNGGLDPWSGGGLLPNYHGKLGQNVSVWLIPSGAHHLDLRESNPRDPADVKAVRLSISEKFKEWIRNW